MTQFWSPFQMLKKQMKFEEKEKEIGNHTKGKLILDSSAGGPKVGMHMGCWIEEESSQNPLVRQERLLLVF